MDNAGGGEYMGVERAAATGHVARHCDAVKRASRGIARLRMENES